MIRGWRVGGSAASVGPQGICAAAIGSVGRREFRTSHARLGKQQTDVDFPISSSRKPFGHTEYPGRRDVLPYEATAWRFMKKWELQMKAEWDDLEQFRSLPKPKKQFGNEAAEIVWPYAVLLENVIKVHPFTKSIYCYYPQRTLTEEGLLAKQLAVRFARECLVPITFHNPQCYVETEMLLEHGDTPWIVVHCLDERRKIIPVAPPVSTSSPGAQNGDPKEALLAVVLRECQQLGTSVAQPRSLFRLLNERPNQNHYLRIDYQWMGATPEERMQHTVQWTTEAKPLREVKMFNREYRVADSLSWEADRPLDPRSYKRIRKRTVFQRMRPSHADQMGFFRTQRRVAAAGAGRGGSLG